MRDQQHLRLLLQRTLGSFAIIVLVLGGLSITNTMLMSVMTRQHEIGLRLALGATKEDIVSQFVVESLVICGIGGISAIGIGAIFVIVLSPLFSWSLIVNLNVILLAIAASLLVSAAAGGLPALRASRVPPAAVLA
jgi:ABC-type antimicrobial peptide transport system permease subunit